MATGSIVLDDAEHIDERTSHALAAAQLEGEARAKGLRPREVVRSVAGEIRRMGLTPNVPELVRRYRAGDTRLPTWLRDRDGGERG